MRVVPYNPGMRITVTTKSEDGNGDEKYLEVQDAGDRLIAIRWHRTKPKKIPKGHALIEWRRKR